MNVVATFKLTQQGIANIQDTCKRADKFKKAAKKMGVKVTDIFWTLGPFATTALMLNVGSHGNVQTQTARAFSAAESDEQVRSATS